MHVPSSTNQLVRQVPSITVLELQCGHKLQQSEKATSLSVQYSNWKLETVN